MTEYQHNNENSDLPNQSPEKITTTLQPTIIAVKESFGWIEKEELLREEGTIYGLADCGLSEKQTVIEQYYLQQIDEWQIEEETLTATLSNDQHKIEKSHILISGLEEEIHQLSAKYERQDHHFYRTLFGLVVYIFILAFAFVGTFEWVAPQWTYYPILVTLGIFLFGSLSLLGNLSMVYREDQIVHRQEKREQWKSYVEEYVIPLVCAIFIFICGMEHQSIGLNFIFSLFTFLVFIFVGKGLLMSMLIIAEQYKIVRYNRTQKHKMRSKQEALYGQKEEERQRINKLEDQIQDNRAKLKSVQQAITKTRQTAATKIAYFTSEYELARQANKEGAFIRYLQNHQV